MVNLNGNPFYLDDNGIKWVEDTLKSMTLEEKIGQLFCLPGVSSDKNLLEKLTKNIGVGGIMYRPTDGKSIQETHRTLQDTSKIPLLIAANLEAGGNGIVREGTDFAKPLQVGATDDPEMGYALGKISCSEGAAVGCNWSFAPIVDIDMNFRNPITNLRTFGDNAEQVIKMAKRYMDAAKEEGVAVSIKHFPGDGVDERDQHLLTSVNSLTVEEWDNSFGKVYQELIDYGAQTVMVGHIAQPAYAQKLNPELDDKPVPATLSKELVTGLLREKLGFNGLAITDASQMVGYTTGMKREDAVPTAIAVGCDMLLFTKNMEEDIEFMFKGYHKGLITDERLNEAVTRILATKAALNLHEKQAANTLVPSEEALSILKNEKHIQWAKECADKGITLVKNLENLLPLNNEKYKKVYLNVLEENDRIDSPLRIKLKSMLEGEGFDVDVRNRDFNIDMEGFMAGKPDARTIEVMQEIGAKVSDFTGKYDLAIYVANFETASNNTVIRINWKGLGGMGDDAPWFTAEVPTVFISLANPYHLLDVPMVHSYVNAYTNNEYVLENLFDKLMGRSEFKGKSPVDAFCGRVDARY
ncbi:glycoside hydrolase family 3 protein [Litchfieldia alkalitelluris]|uniref:glycoside hydrolase family 3 protein n=1 Tax=Litchfieldia alkalitelluris TaxID=304268 RepID=UPI0009983BF6|nr:glycoside hydrolase family 3 N-terminal domain-containing protein [Litchfieldia alkalitelluris]